MQKARVNGKGKRVVSLPFQLPFLAAGLLLSAVSSAFAQWATQSITLNPGWNAVYLGIQPAPDDCETIFAGLPIESVWAWNRRFTSVQFIEDASSLQPGQPDWLMYAPADNPARAVRNLFALLPGSCYLVKLKPGAGPVTWNVVGHPVTRQIDWLPSSLNLVGFPLGPGPVPTFQNFFASSPAHAGQPIYRLSASGLWERVTSPATTSMRANEAFWIHCKDASTFSGSVQLTPDQRDGLLYGSVLTEQTIRIRNTSALARTLTVQALTSQSPPNSSFPLLAGPVPLSYYKVDTTNSQFGWVALTAPLTRPGMQPGEEWVLRLAVNRTQMANFNPPATHNGVLYQSVLQISSDDGMRYRLSVSSEGLKHYPPTSGAPEGLLAASPPSVDPRAGLWVGSAVVDRVSHPSNPSAPNNPVPVASPAQFRLILHVDNGGNVRLLQKVLQMFKPGTLKPDPTNPSVNIIDEPARYVLVTDDALIPNFSGATLRDGEPVARRLSSAAFSFREPIVCSAVGSATFGSGTFTCQISLDYDDPLNPFKHRFHPAHNNLDPRFETKLPEGAESFTVTRQIELEFTAQDPDNLTVSGWGDNQLGGTYRESISGLHRQVIRTSGTFRLVQASRVGTLNDSPTP